MDNINKQIKCEEIKNNFLNFMFLNTLIKQINDPTKQFININCILNYNFNGKLENPKIDNKYDISEYNNLIEYEDIESLNYLMVADTCDKLLESIENKNNKIDGVIYLEELSLNKTKIYGKVSGLKLNAQHAIHIHEAGDLTDGCKPPSDMSLNYFRSNDTLANGLPVSASDTLLTASLPAYIVLPKPGV